MPAGDVFMSSCSSSSPAAKFAQSYSLAALLKAAQDPAADKNKNGIPDGGEKNPVQAGKTPGTGIIVDKNA